jgi:TolB protein
MRWMALTIGSLCGACSSSGARAPLTDAAPPIDTAPDTRQADAALVEPGVIAYAALDGSVSHLYLMDVNASGVGSNVRRLTADTTGETYATWSPGGDQLSYQSTINGSATYVINSDGTGERRLSPTPGMDVTPSWSPDGTKIVYARLTAPPQPDVPPQTDLRIMNADGTGDHVVLANTKFSVEPRWSINNTLTFMSYMDGPGLNIYTIQLDGTGLHRLTNNTANNAEPVWSHDGSHIAFGSDREGGGKLNLFRMNADGSGVVQLTHFDVPDEAGDVSWSADDSNIAFEWDVDGVKQSSPTAHAEVWTVRADGSDPMTTTIACSDVGCAPRWKP